MKVFTRVLSLTLIAIMLCFSLASCAKKVETGEYVLGDPGLTGCYTSYTFDGKTFSYATYINYVKQANDPASQEKGTLSYSGEYEIEVVKPEDKEARKADKDNGITRGNITFTWVDAAGATKTETLPIVIDEVNSILTIGDVRYVLRVSQ
ncbi:MAG: hypothetical protein IJC95_01565 [Clostridia bacterium]|nr:hypothetical protein [Clostridia bacterium]MBQ3056161.1 hypothetical protein [Clostridia bacterium]